MSERSAFAALVAEVREGVETRLEAVWAEAESRHARHGRAVRLPLTFARDLCLRGGKRLRAGLVATGHRVGGGVGLSSVWDVACAVELLQAYFLIHDDWMDGDRTRRGGAAVHAALEQAGEPESQAARGAVLAGDYTLALATEALSRALPGRRDSARLVGQFAAMQLDAVVGQELDVLGDGEDVELVYRLKTASYSVSGPLKLGLILAGEGDSALAAIDAFAMPLGIAFQLRDDLIGAYADERSSGKPRGSDLRAGKKTMLARLALELASGSERSEVEGVLGRATATARDLDRALLAMQRCGARSGVEARITTLVGEATSALSSMPLSSAARALLDGVVTGLVNREL